MKITQKDVTVKRKEFDERTQSKDEREKERAKETIIEKLARTDYDGVLELVAEYGINIPARHLRAAARLYEQRSSSSELMLARFAYQKLGNRNKVKSLRNSITSAREREALSEMTR